jgi:hypothetical protein
VHPIADPRFLTAGGVHTILLLPPEVTIAASGATPETPDDIAARFEPELGAAISAELWRRGYATTPGPSADALLHVGGFAYAGEDHDGIDGGDVATAIVIGIFIVVVIAALVIMAKGGHGGGPGGAVASAAGRSAGHATVHLAHGAAHGLRAVGNVVSQFQIGVPLDPPVPDAGPSHTLLQISLVEPVTGRLLWQAREDFPANPARPGDIHETVGRLLERLPPAR